MSNQETNQSWIEPVSVNKVEEYILKQFPEAHDIEVVAKNKKYIVSFFAGALNFEEEFGVVILDEFTTSIEGNEFDAEWLNIVRECNEGRTIDGWTYEQDLVRSLEVMVYHKKNAAIKRAEEEYKKDVKILNDLFKNLDIQEEIEERQF